jgi:hypothetical protein
MTWFITGNANIDPTKFLGTLNDQPLIIKTHQLADDSEKMRINPDGNVGIGKAPGAYKLDVEGVINASDYHKGGLPLVSSQWTDASGGISYGEGNVGIGKAPSASYKLDVAGTINATGIRKNGVPVVSSQWKGVTGGINYGGGNVGIGHTSPPRPLQVGDDVGGVGFSSSDANPNAGYVRWGDNTGWSLHFGRSRESSGGALNTGTTGVLMTMQDNGNIGIGTTAPRSRLQVRSLTAIDEGTTGAGAWANFGSNAFFDGTWRRIDSTKAGVNLHMNSEGGGQEFRFLRQEADGSNLRNIAVIGSGRSFINEGNVGIGTTGPGFRLDVADRIRLRQGAAGTAGLWLFQSTPGRDQAFIGMRTDTSVGLWGNTGVGWGLFMDTGNGDVTIRGNLISGGALFLRSGSVTGTQFTASLNPGQTGAWFTHSWSPDNVVDWSIRPTTPGGRLSWNVEIERAANNTLTYHIRATNTGSVATNLEAKYMRLT